MLTILRDLTSFIFPRSTGKISGNFSGKLAAVIPTYKPSQTTYELISYLLVWNPDITVILVNDCAPDSPQVKDVFEKITKLATINSNLRIINTPENRHKTGALNYGLAYIEEINLKPDAIITLDDDVIIQKYTIRRMINDLFSFPQNGAVASMVRIKNKNNNLLTRLQGLEYHGFNVIKIADNGFYQGPLVMQGMLTAFRYEAILRVGGFTPDQVIEDYDITAKIKKAGWNVIVSINSTAWTEVPERFGDLWRQRIRWSYNGLKVVRKFINHLPSILQDVIGHISFLTLFSLVMLSFLVPINNLSPQMVFGLALIGAFQFFIGLGFQVITLTYYKDADYKDWILRLSIIPEYVYSSILSLILLGSYLYYILNTSVRQLSLRVPLLNWLYRTGIWSFAAIGYSENWVTRNDQGGDIS